MPTIQIELTVDDLLNAVAQLEPRELAHFIDQVLTLQAERRAPHLSAAETDLLLKINEPVPLDLKSRSAHLVEKRRAETLSAEEHAELIDLSDRIEQLEVARTKNLIALARLRQVSLDELLNKLGIRPRSDTTNCDTSI